MKSFTQDIMIKCSKNLPQGEYKTYRKSYWNPELTKLSKEEKHAQCLEECDKPNPEMEIYSK